MPGDPRRLLAGRVHQPGAEADVVAIIGIERTAENRAPIDLQPRGEPAPASQRDVDASAGLERERGVRAALAEHGAARSREAGRELDEFGERTDPRGCARAAEHRELANL